MPLIAKKSVFSAERNFRPYFQISEDEVEISVLDLPSEMLVEIATYLDTTRNLVNFKLTCTRIYNAIESEKVDRKRLPHFKISKLWLCEERVSQIDVRYWQKNDETAVCKRHIWDPLNQLSTQLHILIQHWRLEDNIVFWDASIFSIPLLKCLLEISYGNSLECQLGVNHIKLSKPSKLEEGLPFVLEFLKKVVGLFNAISYS